MKTAGFSALMGILCVFILLSHCERSFAAEGDISVLTEAQVKKFLNIFPSYAAWIKKKSKVLDQLEDKSDALQIVNAARFAKDHQKFFQKQGWAFEEFFNTAQQVLHAYAALETREHLQEGRRDMEMQRNEALAQIQQNPHLTPEQKQMMLQQMGQMEEYMKMAGAIYKNVPQENLALVKKYREAIAEVLRTVD
ncbi:MAG: hypothetical protein JRI22_15375 [Deltaproteobacteria bacterium]|nr:hypothetical protein [Deltaproteobacteria bacterium]